MNILLITIIAGFIILLGIVGSVLPFLPGLPVALLGLILYAWLTHFQFATVLSVVVFSVLTGLTILVDTLAPSLGAQKHQASRYGRIGAFAGTILGVVFFGPLGIIIGPFVGAVAGELLAQPQNHEHALRVGWGALSGMLFGSIFKLVVAASMLGYFIVAIIKSIH